MLPHDFDYNVYLDLNKDIQHLSEIDAKQHYLENLSSTYKYEQIKIFVCCSGKSGSSTLRNTFMNNNYNTLWTHSNFHFKEQYSYPDSIFELIKSNSKKHDQIYVFDSYRTPIERKISSFFQNIDTHMPTYKKEPIDKIINKFNDLFFTLDDYESLDEILKYFEINTIDDHTNYFLIKSENITFVKLKFSRIHKWADDLTEIIGHPIIMFSDNLSNNKDYKLIYKNFIDNYKIPSNYLNEILNMSHLKLFLSKNEFISYINHWISNITSDHILKYKNIKFDFNPKIYKKLNEDLQFMSDFKATFHYYTYGCLENRKYCE